jgi:MSHA biogenesis protein MshM
MYLEHFGLQRQPFKITPDTSMFYTGNKRGAALEALKYAILSGEGIIKVVGEVGAGKTMLCRMLEVELDETVEVVYIANPSLSPENILHVIAFELKLNITSESSKLEVMQALQTYLLDKHAHNKQVVVFVEEAQSMPIETLEEIRLLSNLETNDNKLLQMVLFGQPELDDKLRQPSIRQLKERITQNFYLEPFPAADVYAYLNFRMRAVGYRGPDLFSQKTANNIERKSSGLTRRINILADKALLAAFSDGGHNIESRHISLAAKDSDFGQEHKWQPAIKLIVGIAIVITSVWIGTLLPSLFSAKPEIKGTPALTQPTVVTPGPSIATESGLAQSAVPTTTTVSENAAPLSIEQRIQQTHQWLETAIDDDFTIQLILLDLWAKDEVNNYLQQASQSLDSNRLFIYQVSIRGRMVYSVLYNEYPERNLATQQLKQLPDKIRQNAPYLRTIKGIKADIRKTKLQHDLHINEAPL